MIRKCVLAATVATLTLSGGLAQAMSLSGSGAAKPTYGPAAPSKSTTTTLPARYKTETQRSKVGVEPLRGPWRVTKSLKNKGKQPVDENGNTYACVDQACKVSRKTDERRD